MKPCMGKFVIAIGVLFGTGCAIGLQEQTSPAHDGTPQALSQQSSVDQILDALERRGRDLRALRADVRITDTDVALQDNTSRSGSFMLQNRQDGSTRARIVFDKKVVDTKATSEKIEYMLDGGKLIDRNYNRKKQTTRTILRPGEKMNLLKLGEGPFPLPIGQKRDDVRAQFEVNKIDPASDDPPGTVHLQLIPKEKTSLARKFKTIDTWVDLSDELPMRIKTLERNEINARTTDLQNVQINPELKDAEFVLPKIGDTWDVTEESFQDAPNQSNRGR